MSQAVPEAVNASDVDPGVRIAIESSWNKTAPTDAVNNPNKYRWWTVVRVDARTVQCREGVATLAGKRVVVQGKGSSLQTALHAQGRS